VCSHEAVFTKVVGKLQNSSLLLVASHSNPNSLSCGTL
jgi:hypothetical protein